MDASFFQITALLSKHSCEGAVDPPVNLGKNTVEFLRDLQGKSETVRTYMYAQQHDAIAQQQRISRYNKRAREKKTFSDQRSSFYRPEESIL